MKNLALIIFLLNFYPVISQEVDFDVLGTPLNGAQEEALNKCVSMEISKIYGTGFSVDKKLLYQIM